MSLFFTARQDGVLEAWDFLYRHRAPILECKVADYPLHCLKVTFIIKYFQVLKYFHSV